MDPHKFLSRDLPNSTGRSGTRCLFFCRSPRVRSLARSFSPSPPTRRPPPPLYARCAAGGLVASPVPSPATSTRQVCALLFSSCCAKPSIGTPRSNKLGSRAPAIRLQNHSSEFVDLLQFDQPTALLPANTIFSPYTTDQISSSGSAENFPRI